MIPPADQVGANGLIALTQDLFADRHESKKATVSLQTTAHVTLCMSTT